MKIAITAESSIDITDELLKTFDIKIIPCTICLGEEVKLDTELTNDEIFNYVDKSGSLPKTSAVNDYQFKCFFEEILNSYDAIIHISMSSDISSSYMNASRVAKDFKNVYVIDSKSLSTGIALLAIHARELSEFDIPANEIVKKLELRKKNIQCSFVLNTTKYLYKGGRCNALERLGSLVFRIKPQIIMTNKGMVPGKKYTGKTCDIIPQYVEDTLKEFNTPHLGNCFITYSSDVGNSVIDDVKDRLIKRGFKNIYITTSRSTISSHCGPKCFGILYLNDGD